MKRVLGHPSTNSDTPVNAFVVNGVLKHIPATRTVDKIRASATVIGEDVLGCHPSEFGSHSIRSGAAMAMCLNHVPTHTIMLVGRWSSDAFLKSSASVARRSKNLHPESPHAHDPTRFLLQRAPRTLDEPSRRPKDPKLPPILRRHQQH